MTSSPVQDRRQGRRRDLARLAEQDLKSCARCGQTKRLAEFTRTGRKRRDGASVYGWCATCTSQAAVGYSRAWQERNPQRVLEAHRRREYGLSPEQFNQMADDQQDCCAICQRPVGRDRLCVDHDHVTGRVRGLLCRKCNTALGQLGDDAETAERLVTYLRCGVVEE